MLKKYYYNILMIILLPIVIGFLANPCEAQNKCRAELILKLVNKCSREKRDVIDAEKMATINGADEFIFHDNEQKLLNPGTTIITRRTNPIISGIVTSAMKFRQPAAVSITPIFGRLYLARSSEPRNDGSRLLSEEQGGGDIERGFDMTIGEIEEIYFELSGRSPRHSPKAPLDNALKEDIARCCQNVPLCIKNCDYRRFFNCNYCGGSSV